MGRVHEPVFRIVLTDSKFGPKSGKAVEVLGSFDKRKAKNGNKIDAEKTKYWISKGAQVSATIHNFLVSEKIISGKKINVLPKNKIINAKKAKEAEEAAKEAAKAPKPEPAAEAAAAEAPAAEAAAA